MVREERKEKKDESAREEIERERESHDSLLTV